MSTLRNLEEFIELICRANAAKVAPYLLRQCQQACKELKDTSTMLKIMMANRHMHTKEQLHEARHKRDTARRKAAAIMKDFYDNKDKE